MSDNYSEQSSGIYKIINKLFYFDSYSVYHFKKIRILIKKLIKEFPEGNIEKDYTININTKKNSKDDLKIFTIKKQDSKTLIYTKKARNLAFFLVCSFYTNLVSRF